MSPRFLLPLALTAIVALSGCNKESGVRTENSPEPGANNAVQLRDGAAATEGGVGRSGSPAAGSTTSTTDSDASTQDTGTGSGVEPMSTTEPAR